LAALTPMLPPVTFFVHVPFRMRVFVIPNVTGLAIVSWTIVSLFLLVSVESPFIVVYVVTSVAFPNMANIVFVLPPCLDTPEVSIAYVACVPHG
jgi:hypothetical protein